MYCPNLDGIVILKHPGFKPYPSLDDVWGTSGYLGIHNPAYMINNSVLVSDYCILVAQVLVMFVFFFTARTRYF